MRFEDQPPVRTRTQDLTPAFRSQRFRDVAVPLFIAKSNRTSPYVRSTQEVDAEIAARLADLIDPPQQDNPNFSAPEPASIVDNPQAFASQFLARRKSRDVPDAPTPFQVIPGGRDDGDNQP